MQIKRIFLTCLVLGMGALSSGFRVGPNLETVVSRSDIIVIAVVDSVIPVGNDDLRTSYDDVTIRILQVLKNKKRADSIERNSRIRFKAPFSRTDGIKLSTSTYFAPAEHIAYIFMLRSRKDNYGIDVGAHDTAYSIARLPEVLDLLE